METHFDCIRVLIGHIAARLTELTGALELKLLA
jgi:hypothetical protein